MPLTDLMLCGGESECLTCDLLKHLEGMPLERLFLDVVIDMDEDAMKLLPEFSSLRDLSLRASFSPFLT